MAQLTREQLIDLVEKRYFAAIDENRLDDTLACLTPDCVWHIYPAGTVLTGRDREIRQAFASAFEKYPEMWHGNFEWIVDEPAQRVCAIFEVRLVEADGKVTELSNTKLFKVEDGRFARLDLYFSTAEPIVDEPD